MQKYLSFALIALLIAVYPISSYAIPGTIPFGGNVLGYTYCTCSQNFLVEIGPPNAGMYMFQPTIPGIPAGTDLRAFWSILEPGAYVVGLAEVVPMQCWVYAGTTCGMVGAGPMMLLAGTSFPI